MKPKFRKEYQEGATFCSHHEYLRGQLDAKWCRGHMCPARCDLCMRQMRRHKEIFKVWLLPTKNRLGSLQLVALQPADKLIEWVCRHVSMSYGPWGSCYNSG